MKTYAQRAAALLKKEQEARENGREGAALHIAAEISLTNATILEKRTAIKDLHREAYFLSLERKRKQGVVKTMQDEMTLQREREKLKKKIEAKIKKDVRVILSLQFLLHYLPNRPISYDCFML